VTSQPRQAEVRFYCDADILGLAKVLASLRNDVTYPGDPGLLLHRRHRPPCPVTSPQTPDDEWIPKVAQLGWLIITRDSRIQEHRAEIAAVREYGAKMVALTSRDAGSTWLQLEVVMRQWRALGDLVASEGPFIWRASRSALAKVPLA
jgi:hypothetical protein